ncbi:hypothetical protein BsWGS_08585 [Bradybaena similaris]
MRSTVQDDSLILALMNCVRLLCCGVVARPPLLDGGRRQRQVLVGLLVVVLLGERGEADTERPGRCMGCELFNQDRSRPSQYGHRKEAQFCRYPCQCPEDLACHDGVGIIKDGCGCCYMCARQRGDLCSVRDLCDQAKGLYCDSRDSNSMGVCKGKERNPCIVNGVMYNDGEKFQPECSQLCTCQNGFYGCVNTCPQEQHKPSELTCHEPTLRQVKDNCCKEWTCQKMEASGASVLANTGLESDNLVHHNVSYHVSTLMPPEESSSLAEKPYQSCDKKTTDWTPCTRSCDVGVSTRIVVDPVSCNIYQELQLCYLRPCSSDVHLMNQEKCTPTSRRSSRRVNIVYQDCLSVRDYSLKFCTSCKPGKCCYPRRTRSRPMEFQCSDGKREVYNYLWIKRCRCDTSCNPRQLSSRLRAGSWRQDRKTRRRKNRRRRKYHV